MDPADKMPIAKAADFYRTVFDQSSEASLLTAADGRIFQANAAACALLRRTEEEIRATGRQGLIDPTSPGLGHLLEERAKTGQVQGELIFLRGDGTRFPAEFRSASLFDSENTSEVRNIVTIRDLTEHRATERALTESQVLLDAIVNNTHDMIWSVDPETFGLQWFNNGFREFFRVHRGMRIGVGMRPEDLFSTEEYSRLWRGMYVRALKEGAFTDEYVASTNTRLIQLNVNALMRDGVAFGISVFGRDITRARQSERALQASAAELRASEEQFRAMVERSPTGTVIFEAGRVSYANPAAARIIRAEPTDPLAGRNVMDFVHPDYRAKSLERIRTAVATGQAAEHAEMVFLGLDGQAIDTESVLLPVTIAGRPSIMVLFNDTTERKRATAALRENELKYRTLFESADDAILLVADGRFVDCNPAAMRMFGCTRDQLVGATPSAFSPPEQPDGTPSDIAAARKIGLALSEGPQFFEWEHRRADGTPVSVEVSLNRHDVGGQPQIQSIVRDVTARRAAAEELRKLSRAVEQSQASILITDVKADIEYVNEAFLLRTGYTRQEVMGQNPRFLNSGETPRATFDALWQVLQRGETWSGEFINRKKDGSTFVEQALISPLRQPDGTITHYVAVQEDVTDQKLLAAELARHRDHLMELVAERTIELDEARELAESANRAKSAFLATMSHEIRTPLNGVIAMAEMLALRQLSPEDIESTRTILRSAHNLMAVIDDVLDFSKIEAGKLDLEVADMPLCLVADDVLVALEPLATASDVDLAVHVAPAVPSYVRGDATRVRQILLNLGANAIKFSGGRSDIRGQVTIHVGVVSQSPLRVSLRVTDNGIGMTSETIGRLFRSFTQAEASTTRRFGGTGLGLAITKRLIDLMEGTIEVTSEPGRGSTFEVILQFAPATPVTPVTPAQRDAPAPHRIVAEPVAFAELRPSPLSLDEARAQGRLILVAEDDSMNQKVILQQLGLLGYAGHIAFDGAEALRLWRAGTYAMLLSDLHMPNMDGYELAASIRREEEAGNTHLPIIALTANALHGEAERATTAGMDGYLTKPVPLATLREVLARWIVPASAKSG